MTTEAQDLLDRLSNPNNIKQAEQDKNRPFSRFPGRHVRADIPAQDIEVETRRPENSQFDEQGYYLTVNVLEFYNTGGRDVEPGEHQLWIGIPNNRRDGSAPTTDTDSENARMMLAANEADHSIVSPRNLPGRKNVEFKEDSYDFTYRSNRSGEWQDVARTTYFYRLNFKGSTTNGNVAPVQAAPTPAAVARALEMVKEAGESGIPEAEFNLACTKDPVIKADKAMPKYLTEGKLVSDSNGKVLRDGKILVWAGVD